MVKAGTTLPGTEYINFGAQFSNAAVAIKQISSAGAITYASGIQIDERHIITAAHVPDSNTVEGMLPLERISVIYGGTNAMTNGTEVLVRRYSYHPSYTPGQPSGASGQNGIDLAILELLYPVAGRGIELAQATPVTNEVLNLVGYGRVALPSSSALQPFDGERRGWQMITHSTTQPGYDPSLYKRGYASISTSSLTLPGYAANRDSGGMVINQLGELVGIIMVIR